MNLKTKILSFVLLGMLEIMCLSNTRNIDVKASNEISYNANLTNGLPSEWSVYSKSNKSHISVSSSSESIILNYNSSTTNQVSDKNYYGTLYNIDIDEYEIGDFVLEMTFKATSWYSETRWFGILYHTKIDSNNMLSGYMMNYRVNGQTAQSTISTTPSFNDSLVKNAGTYPALIDKSNHHLKIVASGSNITHYMDDNKIISYDTSTYANSYLNSKDQLSGSFGLILSNISLEISEFKITGTKTSTKLNKVDESNVEDLTNIYNPEANTIGAFAINSMVKSKSDLEDIASTIAKPANAFISINKKMNVIDDSNNDLGISLLDAYKNYLKGSNSSSMLVVKIDDLDIAKEFVNYYYSSLNLIDMAVSGSYEIVKYVRSELPYIRGIVDFSNYEFTNLYELVSKANIANANSIILSQDDASYDNIYYLQARFKTVLISLDYASEYDVISAISNGAYGVIVDNFSFAYNTLNKFSSLNKPINRVPYNVGHRGLPYDSYENSIESFDLAISYGATHIEIDAHVSSDEKLFIMHDDNIDRTTNGTGYIANMTSTELANYKITKNYSGKTMGKGVDIPTMDDVFSKYKGTGIVIVVEIKCSTPSFARIFKEYLDKYDIYDQVVCISFYTAQLIKLKETIPEIPTADLNAYSTSTLYSSLKTLNKNNMGIDDNSGYTDDNFTYQLACRGFASWYWTYDNESSITSAFNSGVNGITNNYADKLDKFALKLNTTNSEYGSNYVMCYSEDDFKALAIDNEELTFYYDTYLGTSKSFVSASVLVKDVHEFYADVIYYAKVTVNKVNYTIFSDVTRLVYEDDFISPKIMNEILAKDVSDLNDEEIETLLKMNKAYEILLPSDKKKVDKTAINKKIDELNKKDDEKKDDSSSVLESSTNLDSKEESIISSSESKKDDSSSSNNDDETKKGCKGNLGNMLILPLIALALLLLRRKAK